jgi:lipid-A-disaccharide synthase
MDSILIIACENSAENYGADLVREFRHFHPGMYFYGIGGKQMQEIGVELLFSIQDLSFIGIFEIIFHIPRILRILNTITKQAKKRNTKAAVLIDSPDFNLRVAKKLKKQSLPVLYYVSPTVWAWRKNRLQTIKKFTSKMMLIFPFEEKIYKDEQIPAAFVGHPLVKKVRVSLSRKAFFAKYEIKDTKKLITLLPGSRQGEIKRHLPVLVKALDLIKKKNDCQFVLKLSDNIDREEIKEYFKGHFSPVKILTQDGYEAMAYSDLVLSACGTANLETALLETPLISFYRISPLSYITGKKLVKIRHFSIVNIISGKEVIPELIQKDFNPESVFEKASQILDSPEIRNKMIADFKKIKQELGGKDAASNAAKELEQLLFKSSA